MIILLGKKKIHMRLNFFKDNLFELLNESNSLKIVDIETNDLCNLFIIETIDGSLFEIECRKIK